MTKSVILEDVCGGWACEDQMCSEAEMGRVEFGAYSTKEQRKAKVTQGIFLQGANLNELSLSLSLSSSDHKATGLQEQFILVGEHSRVVSTLSHMSPGSSLEYQPTALLPGMCRADNCLVHNYLPNPVVNEMNDLVILVGNGPHCTRTYYCICEAGRNALPRHLCVRLTMSSLCSSSTGEGRLPEAMGVARSLYTAHMRRSWKHLGAK